MVLLSVVGIAGAVPAAVATPAAPAAPAVTATTPPDFTGDSERCRLDDDRIAESSGLAVSTWDPARLWTHNDSGDVARVFALGPPAGGRCPTLGTVRLAGVDAFDAEDLAPGPGHTLWLADIGDNIGQRQRIVLDRFAEPQQVAGDLTVPAARFRFTYPDGPHNAEAFLVSPRTGQVVVVTKGSAGKPLVYAARGTPALGAGPAPADPQPLMGSGELDAPESGGAFNAITGGATSPDGRVVVLRTYLGAYVYDVTGDDLVAALHRSPRRIDLPSQPQGEGVAFTADGRSILLSSEGTGTAVITLRRQDGELSTVDRIVGGHRHAGQVIVGAGLVALAVLVLVLTRRRRRRGRA